MNIRPITPKDYDILQDFLYYAVYVPPGAEAPPRAIVDKPEIAIYINGFGGEHDCGVACEQGGKVVGAAWARIIPAFGHVDDETPELAISVLPAYRGRGIGTALMTGLLAELSKRGYGRASLSVQKDNPAAKLYLRLGFNIVKENEGDFIMAKDLNIL